MRSIKIEWAQLWLNETDEDLTASKWMILDNMRWHDMACADMRRNDNERGKMGKNDIKMHPSFLEE